MCPVVGSAPRDLAPVVDDETWLDAVRRTDDPLVPAIRTARERGTELTDRAVERIVASIPAYADAIPADDLWLSVSRNLDLNLLVLVERRDITPAELAARAALGERRARAGLPISDLLRAFRVGYLVLWDGLREAAQAQGRDAVDRLLEEAGRIWDLLDRISSAVAERHRETLARQDVDTRRRSLALVAGVGRYPDERDTTEAHARDLGLDTHGPFVAAVCDGHVHRPGTGGCVVAEQPDRTVVLLQPTSGARSGEALLEARLREQGVTGIGLGLAAHGLAGARRSLAEAQRMHRCARELGRDALSWREGWFTCLVHEAAASLEPLVGDAVAELGTSADAAGTVAELLAANGNLSAAARRLHLHPNTVAYRLQRLRQASGLDVREPGGLLKAQLALALADRGTASTVEVHDHAGPSP